MRGAKRKAAGEAGRPARAAPAPQGARPSPSYWLVKSEPDEYSIDTLAAEQSGSGRWDGVRNYQARNALRAMTRGDAVLFYHSSCKDVGVVGLAEVAREA